MTYRASIGWAFGADGRLRDLIVNPSPDLITATADVQPEPGDWQDRARCTETDPEIFFPEKGGSTREAKKVCAGCEVRVTCLEFALENEDVGRFGIWGGTSERERRRIRHSRGLPVVAAETGRRGLQERRAA